MLTALLVGLILLAFFAGLVLGGVLGGAGAQTREEERRQWLSQP